MRYFASESLWRNEVKRSVFAVLIVLASCANLAPPIPAISYRAAGTEPFWGLKIDNRQIEFTLAGSEPVRQPTPKVIVGIAGEIYQTARINVSIVHGSCSDGMSDRTYPDKVQLVVDGHQFSGCGGL
jgi:uncharacterized membrane protein